MRGGRLTWERRPSGPSPPSTHGSGNTHFLTKYRDQVVMARAVKVRGQGRRPRAVKQEEQLSSSVERRGKKSVSNLINEETNAYREGTNEEIRILIEEWEANLNRQASTTKIETEDWCTMVSNPRHTHGWVTQSKQTLYLYWIMKSLPGKALEKILVSTSTTVQDFPNYKQDFQKL